MKNSASKILFIISSALLIIADPIGRSTMLSAELHESSYSTADRSPKESPQVLLADEVRSVNQVIIRKYSEEYGIDYRLILAMMKQESQFDENAVSERGAIGLMQIMPVTHMELNEELDLEGSYLPEENVRVGIYYFSKLVRLFKTETRENGMRLALAAYNAGPSRVYDAQDLAAYLGENPIEWTSIRHVLPLLSKRYYSLHHAVWTESRPPAGYFGSWKETTNYVDNIMKTYHQYLSLL